MRPISVGPYSFTISCPFAAGHPLTESEAQALNSLRAENIRNSLRRWVELEEKLAGGLLTSEQLERLRQKLAQYDESYTFGRAPKAEPKGLALMLRIVAEETLGEEMRRQGLSLEYLVNREELMSELESSEPVQREARRRLEARQRVATSVLAELEGLAE